MGTPERGRLKRCAAIAFLVSLSMLSAEVTVTRLLSYKFFFHFVFLVLSLAQLGIAASAAQVYVSGQRTFGAEFLRNKLFGMCVAPVLFLAGYVWLAPAPEPGWTKINGPDAVPYLVALSLLLVVFYYCTGGVLAALFTEHKPAFNRLYAADLVGAAAGCLVALGLMWAFGPARAFLASGLMAAAAALLVDRPVDAPKRGWAGFAPLALAVAVSLFCWARVAVFERGTHADFEYEWNHLARTERYGPGFYVIDGDAGTILNNPEWTSEVEFLVAPRHPRVAIIGVGAGPQLRMAQRFEPASVFAVDINPTIISWDFGKDSDFNDHIFTRPGVTVVVDEGRHAIRSQDGDFDVIVMHAIDTYTASSMGAYSLTENYLYTVEACEDFYRKLSPQGVVAVRRALFYPPRETLRLFITFMDALAQQGIEHPEDHIIVLSPTKDWRQPKLKATGEVMVSKQPFTAAQLAAVDEFVRGHDWDYLYRPGTRLDTAFWEYVNASDRDAFRRDYAYLIDPCYDSNPFFFQLSRPFAFLYDKRLLTAPDFYIYTQSTNVLFITLLLLVVLTYLLLARPLLRHRRQAQLARPPAVLSTYFVCLGLGFMAVEMASIQTMTLLLGHPTYALSIILLGTLAFAGLGSYLVRCIPPGKTYGICPAIALLSLGAGFGLLPLVHHTIAAPFGVRIAIAIASLALIATPMGMPMALGIRAIGEEDQPQVAWAWACNGAAGVLSTNVCMILMVYYGTTVVFLVGSGTYLLNRFLLLKMIRSASAPADTAVAI